MVRLIGREIGNQNFICGCRLHELNVFHPQRTRKNQALKTKVNSTTIGGFNQSDSRRIVVEPYLSSGFVLTNSITFLLPKKVSEDSSPRSEGRRVGPTDTLLVASALSS
jgi:hypothetical protein